MPDENKFVEDLAEKDDFSQWYLDVVYKAELADESPVRGCMVIRPYGYALWENMQRALDDRIKATGHENAYFPLFIPSSFLQREAEHIRGFAPEVAEVAPASAGLVKKVVAVKMPETVVPGRIGYLVPLLLSGSAKSKSPTLMILDSRPNRPKK